MLFQVLFLAIYDLLLSKETFFNTNRGYLLGVRSDFIQVLMELGLSLLDSGSSGAVEDDDLRKKQAGMVSSDDFIGESSRNSFEEAFIKLVEDNKVVVYDKNIPDGDGLARLLGRHVMGNARVVK
ncbi:hypothetical protein TL16_g13383, partial [Triparma laevis f. inornata]